MRDRLIELLKSKAKFRSIHISVAEHFSDVAIEALADHLLANGVIVQVQGHWIEQSDGWDGVLYTCSACRCDWCTIDGTPLENNMRFCPECGAKMDGLAEREGKV